MRWAMLVVLGALGCASTHNYPQGFRYYEEREVASAMVQMAGHVRGADTALRAEDRDASTQAEVVRHLDAIDSILSRLDAGGQPTNHPRLDDHLEDFRRQVALARANAAKEPPDYFLTGTLTGACFYCHAGR